MFKKVKSILVFVMIAGLICMMNTGTASARERAFKDVMSEDAATENIPSEDLPSEDKPSADLPSEDKPSADLPSEDKPSADLPSEDKPSADLPSEDKPSTGLPSEDKPSADLPSEDKPSADLPSEDKPSEDKPSEDNPSEDAPSRGVTSNAAFSNDAIAVFSVYGAEVDGYNLNHNFVQVLNINQGNITIGDESFTQQNVATDEPWDTKTDAYVIRGKGNSTNNIVITATKKTTIYLMDLEWSGSIIYNSSNNINFVICGKVVNRNNFLIPAAAGNQINSLTVSGYSPEAEINVTKGFFSRSAIKDCTFRDVIVTANRFDSYGTLAAIVYMNNNIADTTLNVMNSTLDIAVSADVGWSTNNFTAVDSVIKNLTIYRQGTNGPMNITGSNVTNLFLFEYPGANIKNVLTVSDSHIENLNSRSIVQYINKYGDLTYLYAANHNLFQLIADTSVLKIGTSPILSFEADRCTIETEPNAVINNFIAEKCSIKGVFTGTPADYQSNDLIPKIIRLREHPNEFAMVSFDGGEPVKLLLDLNGCLYPYVKASCTKIEITTEDGHKTNVTFTPGSTDDGVVDVDPGSNSGGPVIADPAEMFLTCEDKKIFTISVSAAAKNPDDNGSLTYQWFKNGEALEDETDFEYSEKAMGVGEYEYYCVVTDLDGTKSTSKTITVSVTAKPNLNAPAVSSQTSNMALVAGSDVTLIVNGKPKTTGSATYQWYKGSAIITGATSGSLALTKVKAADAGNYKCVITDTSNNFSSDSAVYRITIK